MIRLRALPHPSKLLVGARRGLCYLLHDGLFSLPLLESPGNSCTALSTPASMISCQPPDALYTAPQRGENRGTSFRQSKYCSVRTIHHCLTERRKSREQSVN